MSEVRFRPMTAADGAAVLAMMRTFYASPAVLSNGSEEIFQRDIAACVSDSPYAEGFVFDTANGVAGYGMLAHSYSTEFGKPCVWIEDLYIQPAYRRQGIGSEFIAFVKRRYPQALLRLEAERENLNAIAAYRKSGFCELSYLEMVMNGSEP